MHILHKLLHHKRRSKFANPRLAKGRKRLFQLSALLFGIILLHTLGMVIFEKDIGWWDGFWLSWTTATTVGYGDLSASTPLGRLTTLILMYCVAISLLAQLASEYIEYRIDSRERKIKGLWEWKKMQDHILIINTPQKGAERYLNRLIKQIRLTPSLTGCPIQILTRRYEHGLPQTLNDQNVVHYHGHSENSDALRAVHVDTAKYVYLVARDEDDSMSDSLTFDVLTRIKEIGCTATIVAEAVEDANRARFETYGADSVIRPIRAYPALVARAMDSPGTEKVLENLFSHKGDHPHRFDLNFDCPDWKSLACKIMMANIGTPMGYINTEGEVITNPKPNKPAKGASLLILIHQDNLPENDVLESCINS
ncbi:MAG: metal transporter [Methylococcales bacterium]|jgi:voltage-gated potassium channel|nr:metal transporter [Methylococcales bacterium]MBT7444359.1 metal transporter [Methylococcales bacterium]